jgi:hypothetical protein
MTFGGILPEIAVFKARPYPLYIPKGSTDGEFIRKRLQQYGVTGYKPPVKPSKLRESYGK